MKRYYPWIDWAKAIGLYLMVLGHGGLVSDEIRTYIYHFHMPFFLMVSGMLYHPKTVKATIVSGIKTLIVPYFLINLLCLCGNVTFAIFHQEFSSQYLIQRIGAIALGLGYATSNWIPVCPPTWFLVVLFFVRIISSLLNLETHTITKSLIVAIMSMCMLLLLNHFAIDLFVPIDSALMALPFFVLGFVLRDYLLEKISKQSICLVGGIALLIILVFTGAINTQQCRVDMDSVNYGSNILLFYFNGALGGLGLIAICKSFNKELPIVSTISKGAVLIIGTNLTVIYLFEKLVALLGITMSTLCGCLMALLVIVVMVPLISLCQKFFPALLGFRK